jgi:hypothetical protein
MDITVVPGRSMGQRQILPTGPVRAVEERALVDRINGYALESYLQRTITGTARENQGTPGTARSLRLRARQKALRVAPITPLWTPVDDAYAGCMVLRIRHGSR